jgi:hypothetical protein
MRKQAVLFLKKKNQKNFFYTGPGVAERAKPRSRGYPAAPGMTLLDEKRLKQLGVWGLSAPAGAGQRPAFWCLK